MVENEPTEVLQVLLSHTISYPGTVVVETGDAMVAKATVFWTSGFFYFTGLADIFLFKGKAIKELCVFFLINQLVLWVYDAWVTLPGFHVVIKADYKQAISYDKNINTYDLKTTQVDIEKEKKIRERPNDEVKHLN